MKVSQETGLKYEIYGFQNGLSLGGRQVGGDLFFAFRKWLTINFKTPTLFNR